MIPKVQGLHFLICVQYNDGEDVVYPEDILLTLLEVINN